MFEKTPSHCAQVRLLAVRFAISLGIVLGLLLLGNPGHAAPLKVGLTAKSTPCVFNPDGQWRGSFYETWNEISVAANLPFEVVNIPNFKQLLQAGQEGQVDVAVSCVNMTAERLSKYRFSVPVQEDGVSVMVRKEPFHIWTPVVRTLFSLDLLELLGGILAFILAMALVIWKIEKYATQESTLKTGKLRTFSKLFQILLSGPGTNVIANSARSNTLIGVTYFVRVIAASVLVSFVSVNIIKKSTQDVPSAINGIQDLAGKTVSVGTGSVSEHWVNSYNAQLHPSDQKGQIHIKQIDSLQQSCDALRDGQVDAVIADHTQVQYYLTKVNPRAPFQIVIRNVHRQSQGLIFSPQLPPETALQINQAIARLKENGTVDNIKKRWVPE
ncbi:MAG TPA: transporter substrate-binding domain-containing protein [Pseudomonadota bacterium]|nr:transporter substrate-binding domain-containing protein [Pseudomonadota bacterium]HNF96328.1 transporter substrate-binding domain-containing protein [Pseudomonadota bacterium]HNI58703.1 transporter substrate-binding domain-containing protein [Pseudomonadota bacterium]HNK44282.1 transporter substrate-binding domain-containing protein [Pseudomonadota bacterium]